MLMEVQKGIEGILPGTFRMYDLSERDVFMYTWPQE